MNVGLKKYLFFGAAGQRDAFFEDAQQEGIIQFLDGSGKRSQVENEAFAQLSRAIRIVRRVPPVEQEENDELYSREKVAQRLIDLERREEELLEEERTLQQEIVRVDVFGAFSTEDIEFIQKQGKRVIQFFFSRKAEKLDLSSYENLFHVGKRHGMDYFISINPTAIQVDGLIGMVVDRPVDQLQARLAEVKREVGKIEEELKDLARFNHFLHEDLMDAVDEHSLGCAQDYVQWSLGDRVFAVEGWTADDKVDSLKKLIDNHGVHGTQVALGKGEIAPTCLSNKGASRIGEDLVHIYDTPSYEDRDPSLWVLWVFSLFFAMIVGDAGYGLIFLLSGLYLQMKFPDAGPAGKRFFRLVGILSVSCIAWGLLTTSFFGLDIGLDSPLRQVSLIDWLTEKKVAYYWATQDSQYTYWTQLFPQTANMTDPSAILAAATNTVGDKTIHLMFDKISDGIMLEIAILAGILHVICGSFRYLDRNWAAAGWIIAIVGGYLFCPSVVNATSMANYVLGVSMETATGYGLQFMIGGIVLACFLSLIQNKLGGLAEIVTSIQIFSDILSYLRLYALGLAGGMMSATFNQIGASAGFAVGLVIILIGHSVNIVLSIMGGVIHGLRLNFLEWYHYCFEGGGRLFKPLSLTRNQ